MNWNRSWLLLVAVFYFGLPTVTRAADATKQEWIQLFNGKNLDGWRVKIRGHEVDDNFGDTFRVEDGLLTVSYDQYQKPFNQRFGHIFFNKPFSNYVIRVEYRFVGDQIDGGPGWAFRNSGIMLHGQSPESMKKGQDFPDSIEVQLLGGNGKNARTTANVCTPGTHIHFGDKLIKRHCNPSKSKTYHGDQWVTLEVEVREDELIKHIMDDKVVLEYTKPQKDNGELITGGYISLQSESHPVQFRKVEIRELKD
ncbi:MAG: DUF1080 domain-containing protein [Pirellulaceae bacterium]|nr:DUF1080 domain-containing protein [Pirellulaceae bacterium]